MPYTHRNTHTHWYTWPIYSFFPSLFPFFLPAAHQRKADLLKRAVGREYILSVQNEISLIFLCPLACLFLSLSVPSYFSSQVSHSISHSRFLSFSNLLHIYSYLYFLLTLPSFPLSVWGTGNSPSIAPWANKMTHWFLITSALSYSSSIILLVSTT